jgi:hypothetical protein
MSINPNLLIAGGLGAALLLVTALVAAVLGARYARVRRRLESIEEQFERFRADVAASTGISVRAGEKLRRLDQLAAQLGERLGQMELRGEGRPYDQAIALVQRGAGSDRLMSHYGLSRGEADLVTLVHGGRQTV